MFYNFPLRWSLSNTPHPTTTDNQKLYHFTNIPGHALCNVIEWQLLEHGNSGETLDLRFGPGAAAFETYSFYMSFPLGMIQHDRLNKEQISVFQGNEIPRDQYEIHLEANSTEFRICVLFKEQRHLGKKSSSSGWSSLKLILNEIYLEPDALEEYISTNTINGAAYRSEDDRKFTTQGNNYNVFCEDFPMPQPKEYKSYLQLANHCPNTGNSTVSDVLYDFPGNIESQNDVRLTIGGNPVGADGTLSSDYAVEVITGVGDASSTNYSFYFILATNKINLSNLNKDEIVLSNFHAPIADYVVDADLYDIKIEEVSHEVRIYVLLYQPVLFGRVQLETPDSLGSTVIDYSVSLFIYDLVLYPGTSTTFNYSGNLFFPNSEAEQEFNIVNAANPESHTVACMLLPPPVAEINDDLSFIFRNTSENTTNVLYIEDETEAGDNIEFIIGTKENADDEPAIRSIELFSESVAVSTQSFSFYIKVDPSAIDIGFDLRIYTYIDDEWVIAPEGDWSTSITNDENNFLVIRCLGRHGVILDGEDCIKLALRGVKPVRRKSSHPTAELYIRQKNLVHEYFCSQPFDILSHVGERYIPIKVAVDGWEVRNNGTSNTVNLHLHNVGEDTIEFDDSKIEVYWDVSNDNSKSFALTKTGSTAARVTVFGCAKSDESADDYASFHITEYNKEKLSANNIESKGFKTITIQNLVTDLPVGPANLYIRYFDVPDYWDGELIVPLMRSNMYEHGSTVSVTNLNVKETASSTDLKVENSTTIGGDLGVGTTDPLAKLHLVDGDLFIGGSDGRTEGLRFTAFPQTAQASGRLLFQQNEYGNIGVSLGYNGTNFYNEELKWPEYSFNITTQYESAANPDNITLALNVSQLNGNTGIRTAATENALEVGGTVSATKLKIGGTTVSAEQLVKLLALLD